MPSPAPEPRPHTLASDLSISLPGLAKIVNPQSASSETPGPAADFGDQVLAVCRLLERWRAEENALIEKDPDEFPPTNWRAVGQLFVFLGLGGLTILIQSWLKFVQGPATSALFITLLAITLGASVVLTLHAPGFFQRQFWRAVWSIFRKKKDNYPFTALHRKTERDLAALPRLASFTDPLLSAVQERLTIVESELRDRLGMLGGNSALPSFVGLSVGVWSAWKSFQGGPNLLSTSFLAGSIGVLWLTGYSFHLRFSVFELSRCRALLALEVGRRKASAATA
jgi:hypothetical protein